MRGPDHRGARGVLALAAERRRRATLRYLRAVAVAEGARNRARLGMVKAESLVAYGLGAGFDMVSEVSQLDELRQALAIAETNLDATRAIAGLPHAA